MEVEIEKLKAELAEARDAQAGMSALRNVCANRGGTPIDEQSNSAEDIVLWADSFIGSLVEGQAKARKGKYAFKTLLESQITLHNERCKHDEMQLAEANAELARMREALQRNALAPQGTEGDEG